MSETSKPYRDACRKSREIGEDNDCAVKAVSIATGQSYEFVLGAMTQAGRPRNAGADKSVTASVIERLGFSIKAVLFPEGTAVSDLPGFFSRGIYLVRTYGHILCLKNGVIHDSSDVQTVTSVWKITKLRCSRCRSTVGIHEYVVPPDAFYRLPDYLQRKILGQMGTIVDLYLDKSAPAPKLRRFCHACAVAKFGDKHWKCMAGFIDKDKIEHRRQWLEDEQYQPKRFN